eukprot:4985748-Pyramimonas_sp.AAC.1
MTATQALEIVSSRLRRLPGGPQDGSTLRQDGSTEARGGPKRGPGQGGSAFSQAHEACQAHV